MPFISGPDGDLKTAFVSDAFLLDQFVGNTLFTQGHNTYGGLGDNTVVNKSNPVQTVAGGINWKQVSVASNNHIAAIKTDGTLWSWGRNDYGTVGDNTSTNKSSPVQTITYGTNWKQVSCGSGHTAAIKTDGTLWSWGLGTSGLLGDNTTTNRSSPVQTIAFGTNWKQVASFGSNTAAIKTDGTLWCWGDNVSGQLGDNTLVSKSSPVQTITGGTNWKQVSGGGGGYVAAIKNDGTLWCWGRNNSGQLGDNTRTNRSSPVQTVAFGTNWKQVSVGEYHTAAIKTDGTLWTWGTNGDGQTQGAGNAGTSPVTVSGSKTSNSTFTTSNTTGVSVGMGVYIATQPVKWLTVATINANASIIFTPTQKGDATTWSGTINLGVGASSGAEDERSSPVQTVAFGTNWKQVACGNSNIAAIKTDGTLWAWGNNQYGGLGDNTVSKRSSPVQTTAYGTNWKQVACGYYRTAAITNGDL